MRTLSNPTFQFKTKNQSLFLTISYLDQYLDRHQHQKIYDNKLLLLLFKSGGGDLSQARSQCLEYMLMAPQYQLSSNVYLDQGLKQLIMDSERDYVVSPMSHQL